MTQEHHNTDEPSNVGVAQRLRSERQLEELDRLIEPWLDDYERTSRAGRK